MFIYFLIPVALGSSGETTWAHAGGEALALEDLHYKAFKKPASKLDFTE
jgi:hypothetical protein